MKFHPAAIVIALILLAAAAIRIAPIAVAQFPGPISLLANGAAHPAPPAPTITGIIVAGGTTVSYTSGIASGTHIGQVAVQETGGTFAGTISQPGGTAGADFGTSGSYPGTYLVANGSTPTCSSATNYPITITPTQAGVVNSGTPYAITVTCNPSGGGASPPAPAQTAGFTTLAFNMDFTNQSQSQLNGVNFNAQTLSSWLDCAGASSPIWQNAGVNNTPNSECEYAIVTDGSNMALHMWFTVSDYNNGYWITQMQTCNGPGSVCSAATFPQGKYVEIVARVPASTLTSYANPGGIGVIVADPLWSWPTSATSGQEWDFVEVYQASTGGYAICCGGMPSNSNVSGFDVTTYNTYGDLYTTNGSSDSAGCVYTNGIAVSGGGTSACNHFGNIGSTDFNARNFLLAGTVGPQGTGNGAPSNQMDIYIQRIRIWECAGWASGQCNGTVYTSAP